MLSLISERCFDRTGGIAPGVGLVAAIFSVGTFSALIGLAEILIR